MNVPWLSKRNSPKTTPDLHSNGLTREQPDTLKAELGLGILQALENLAVTDEVARKLREWNKLHFAIERARLKEQGVEAKPAEDAMAGTTVRIDSNDEQHVHNYPKPGLGPLVSGLLGAALTLGTGGLGFGLWQMLKPATEKIIDNTVEKTLDVHSSYIPPKE